MQRRQQAVKRYMVCVNHQSISFRQKKVKMFDENYNYQNLILKSDVYELGYLIQVKGVGHLNEGPIGP